MAEKRIGHWLFATCCVVLSAWPPLKAGAEPDRSPDSLDSLIVSLDDVRRIADYPDLSSQNLLDVREPRGMHQYDSQYPSQCQVTFDQDVAFGSDWKQFRSVGHVGAANYGVTQAENGCSEMYRVKSSVLIDVAVAHFPRTAKQIATTVVQTISDRITTG